MNFDNKSNLFISDKAGEDSAKDEFGHLNITEVIENILRTQETPFNISLIGGWGLGKSTIIKFLEQQFKEEKNFKFITINAWKYEKEALRKVFLINVYQNLTGRKKDNETDKLLKEMYTYVGKLLHIANKSNKNRFEIAMNFIVMISKPVGVMLIEATVLGVILWVGIKGISLVPYINKLTDGIDNFYLFLFTFLISTLYSISKEIIDKMNSKPLNGVEIKAPIKSTEEFERLLIDNIQKRGKKFKLVCIIDDIDRLSVAKMVEALEAIKSFVDVPKCIFIVPFDREIVKNALEQDGKFKTSNGNDILESELILDKLFQYRLFMHPLVIKNRIPYAVKLCKEDAPGIEKLCTIENSNFFEQEIIPILIHYYVKTPRQIKKIINSFSANLQIFKERIEGNLLIFDFEERSIKTLAVLTVIQTEYGDFYNELINTPSLAKDFIKINEEFTEYITNENKMPESFKSTNINQHIYSKLQKTKALGFDELIHFISRNHFKIMENFEPLLYMMSSRSYTSMGGQAVQTFFTLLGSGSKESSLHIKKISDPIALISTELCYNDESDITNRNYIVGLIKTFNHFGQEKESILNEVAKHIKKHDFVNSDEIDALTVTEILNVLLCSSKDEFVKLLQKKLEELGFYVTDYKYALKNYKLFIKSVQDIIDKTALTKHVYPNKELNETYCSIEYKEYFSDDELEIICNNHIDDNVLKHYLNKYADVVKLTVNDKKLLRGVISKYINSEKTDNLISILIEYLNNPVIFKFFYAVFRAYNNTFEISNNEKAMRVSMFSATSEKVIVTALSDLELDKRRSRYVEIILNSLKFSTISEYVDILDKTINKLYELIWLNDLLKNKIILKQIPNLKIFTNSFIREIFTDQCNKTAIKVLAKYFSEAQMLYLFDLIESTCEISKTGSTVGIEKASILVTELNDLDQYKNILQVTLNKIFSGFMSNWDNSNYSMWSGSIVMVIGAGLNLIGQSERIEYLDLLLSVYNTYPEIAIKAWLHITDELADDFKDKIVETLAMHNFEIDDDVFYECAKKFIGEKVIRDENGEISKFCSSYEKILFSFFQNDKLVDDVIAQLFLMPKIEDVSTFFILIQAKPNVKKKEIVGLTAAKYRREIGKINRIIYKNLDNGKNIKSFVKEVLVYKELNAPRLLAIINYKREVSASDILEILPFEELHSMSYENVYNVAKLVKLIKNEIKGKSEKKRLSELIQSLIATFKLSENESIVEFCNIIKDISTVNLYAVEKSVIHALLNDLNDTMLDINDDEKMLLLNTATIFEKRNL